MMAEVAKIELEGTVGLQPHDIPHLVEERRLSVRRKPHDFVLVAVIGKAEILRKPLIENPQRVREIYPAHHVDHAVAPNTPRRARKVPEAIDGEHCGFGEWRYEIGRINMAQMVLDMMHDAAKALVGKRLIEQVLHT